MSSVAILIGRLGQNGGLEKYSRHLATAFAQRGCKVTILTTGPIQEYDERVKILSLAKVKKLSFLQLYNFNRLCKRWLKKHPQTIVFGMERTCHQTHLRAGSGVHKIFLKKRAVSFFKRLSFYINPLHLLLLLVEKKGFENPDLKLLFTNSNMVKDEILATYRVDPQKICVVHNGVEWQQKQKAFESSFSKSKKEGFEFLFIGNDYKRKGLIYLLQGLSQLENPDWHLTCIGKEKQTPFFKEIACKLKLENQVHFLGPQRDITPFYQRADALLIGSLYDPFSNVTLEALAMGLFVVSSKFNGGYEILTPINGVIIDNLFDATSVASALQVALQHPKSKEQANKIRLSIKGLDFSSQLAKIADKCL